MYHITRTWPREPNVKTVYRVDGTRGHHWTLDIVDATLYSFSDARLAVDEYENPNKDALISMIDAIDINGCVDELGSL